MSHNGYIGVRADKALAIIGENGPQRMSALLEALGIRTKVAASFKVTVDADYRGPVYITVKNASGRPYIVHNGDRIAQMRIEKLVDTEFEWADELSETARGAGGYGSTGR
jgi:deoxyuridine 5'-triphosphate nucleotidohydrolase